MEEQKNCDCKKIREENKKLKEKIKELEKQIELYKRFIQGENV